MTKKELIKELSIIPEDAEIVFNGRRYTSYSNVKDIKLDCAYSDLSLIKEAFFNKKTELLQLLSNRESTYWLVNYWQWFPNSEE